MLIVGCGYIGRRLGRRLLEQATTVCGLVRSTSSLTELRAAGISPLQADLDGVLPPLPTVGARVFYLAPPPGNGSRDPRMSRFLAACADHGQPRRIVYVSTTGVYGDCGGEWIDETRSTRPQADRARRRWDAEQQLGAWRQTTGAELVTVRVAGIYGPGRLPLERLRKQVPMVGAEEAPWTNRIHADDLVSVLMAAMLHAPDGETYNACDGHPGNMREYFDRVADLTGLPRPPLISLQEAEGRLSAGLLSYLAESRRLSNRKLVQELGVQLRYPTLEQGLASCL